MLDAQQLYRCMCLMAGGFPRLIIPKKIDAIFVWGRAAGEWQSTRFDDSVLKHAAALYRLTGVSVVIPDYTGVDKGQGDTGYPGFPVWRDALTVLGVPKHHVLGTVGRGYHTKSEMEDYLELAVERGWLTTVAVTQHFHALRAMLGTVKSLADRHLLHLAVMPVWPDVFDWSRECYGSQGAGPYPLTRWVDEEFDRIERYQKQGWLATLGELLEYLRQIHQKR